MKTKDIVYIALFAALMAGLALFPRINLPILPVPITAQSLGVMLAGSILGAKRGGLSIALFVLLVAIGLPILSGGRGGLTMITSSPTAGYIYGWIFGAFVVGALTQIFWHKLNFIKALAAIVIGGVFCVYLIGVPWYAFVTNTDLILAIKQNMVFIPGDLVKAVLAAMIALKIKSVYPLIKINKY